MRKERNNLRAGAVYLLLFGVWTVLVQKIDLQVAGETGREVGFATLNSWFHQLTGVHMKLYMVTDWLGLVPVAICLLFAAIGFAQLVNRKNLLKVDADLLLLGVYYVLVILGYLVFEMVPINYRPVFIEGRLEASYPSSTTLLVLSVMPTLVFQAEHRLKRPRVKEIVRVLAGCFSAFMVVGRLVAGVHWATDILGAVFLSRGLFCLYKAAAVLYWKEK